MQSNQKQSFMLSHLMTFYEFRTDASSYSDNIYYQLLKTVWFSKLEVSLLNGTEEQNKEQQVDEFVSEQKLSTFFI